MSLIINIDNFESWPEIFEEIQRQMNLKKFTAIEPGTATVHSDTRQTRSLSLTEIEQPGSYKQQRRVSEREEIRHVHKSPKIPPRARIISYPCPSTLSDESASKTIDKKRGKIQPLTRLVSTPCPSIDTRHILRQDSRLTAAALKLSKREMALLYEDILKPLDVYAILRERRKQQPFQ